jgi:hypothetical protein
MFVQYLGENDWNHAAQLAGVIGHYIEDASMPLHATSNYNPGGNHTAFESKVNYEISIDNVNADVSGFVPYELDNIFNSTMQLLNESYQFAENKPDNLSYWLTRDILWNENIKRITENRLRTAAQYLANIWYTGMVQAELVAPPNLISVGVSVVPGYQSGVSGATLVYTVTVNNTGNVPDNYILENSDNSSWNLSLDNTLLVIPAGDNRTTKLHVTLPSAGSDNIIVTAVSRTDNTVSSSASCIANVMLENNGGNMLVAGWNLVGFAGVGDSDTPNDLFAGLSYIMYYWTAPYGPYSEPNKNLPVEDNRGYWVLVNQNCTVWTTGTRPASENIHLVRGWNLVSFPVINENMTPDKIFAPLVYNTDYIMYYWTAPYGPYNEPSPSRPLEDNRAYWVWVNQDKTVIVP